MEPRRLSGRPILMQWQRFGFRNDKAPTPMYMRESFAGQPAAVLLDNLEAVPPPRAQEPESSDEDDDVVVSRIEGVLRLEKNIDGFKAATGQATLPGALQVHAETVAEDPTESAAVQLSSWALLMSSDAVSMIDEAHEIAQSQNEEQAFAVVTSLPSKVEPFVLWTESLHRCDARFKPAIRWGLRAIDAYTLALHAAMGVFGPFTGPQSEARHALKCLISCKLRLSNAHERCGR